MSDKAIIEQLEKRNAQLLERNKQLEADQQSDPDDLDTDYYLLFCDICGVAAEHVLVEDEWQCCGPAHPR